MNVQLDLRMDNAAFLAWVQGREGRYELVRRRVVMVTGGTRGHAAIALNLATALNQRLDRHEWSVLVADFAVDIGPGTVRYPDVVVDSAGGALTDLAATAPALIAEILSPSSTTNDLGDKASEYLRLPSLVAYLVLAQDAPKAWIWIRGTTEFSPGPQTIEGDAVIEIPSLPVTLPLAEIYAGILTGDHE
jgi:Uma2 family endonuclease